jgi:UDP-N-acetylglucosamine--N-acetylmuramyl-(pentapeptide) pyrophosphoryl-undecaprenol N-acetylglucosamine transferase
VFGGSQAVRRINDAVTAALPRLVERVRVVHVTGDAGYAAAAAAREALPAGLRDRYRPAPFLHGEDMTLALAAADLAVGRAGASTLAEAAAFALPTVIVPYPHAAGHQRLNAEAFADAGAAMLIEDEDLDADRLVEAAGLLADPARHAGMSAAARELARPDAAAAVADLVMAVAHREELPSAAEIEAVARGRRS